MKTLAVLLIAFGLVAAQSAPVLAQLSPAGTPERWTRPAGRQKQFNLERGIAIQGYDPVAYFTQNKAVKGSANYTLTHNDVTYRFASAANQKTFQANPNKYEPAYGGWCAYAMGATGEKVEVDPETFKIKDGKLFLFYNKFFTNTLPKWNKDEDNLRRKADQSWSKFAQTAS